MDEGSDRSVEKKLLAEEGNNEDKKVSNLCILYVTAALFGGFVIAEIIGALVSFVYVWLCFKRGL